MADDGDERIIRPGQDVPRSRRNQEARAQKSPTTAEVRDWIVAGVATGAKNVYDQLAEESAKNFEKLEDVVVDRVLREIENRSWRGRMRLRLMMWKEALRSYAIEIGLVDPLAKSERIKIDPASL